MCTSWGQGGPGWTEPADGRQAGFPSFRAQTSWVKVGLSDCGQWLVRATHPRSPIQGKMLSLGVHSSKEGRGVGTGGFTWGKGPQGLPRHHAKR